MQQNEWHADELRNISMNRNTYFYLLYNNYMKLNNNREKG